MKGIQRNPFWSNLLVWMEELSAAKVRVHFLGHFVNCNALMKET